MIKPLSTLCLAGGAALLLAASPSGEDKRIGFPMPEIEARGWINQPPGASLKALRGRTVLIEYWATW